MLRDAKRRFGQRWRVMKFLARALCVGVAWAIVGFEVLAVPGMAWAHHPGESGGLWLSLGPVVFILACGICWVAWAVVRERLRQPPPAKTEDDV